MSVFVHKGTRMKKVLFLIHDLGHGGAEKVLVNLVNNMDHTKFDITVMALFGGGVNEQFLAPYIKLINCFPKAFPGNSHLMKLLSPPQLHRLLIQETYDIEIAYLEGPSARVISGCTDPRTKLVSWIHIEQHSAEKAAASFRGVSEAKRCYSRFQKIVCVSENVRQDFQEALQIDVPHVVLYNTNETAKILSLKDEPVDLAFSERELKLVGVGKVLKSKGFDRLARIHVRLKKQGYPVHTYILGIGPERENIEAYLRQEHCQDSFTFLGYQTNPYKYVSKCDLFVCASFAEGFSTAATESLIIGTPVCTVEVSGMKEMLGENNEYGLVVPNDEDSLYQGIKRFLDEPKLLDYYKSQARIRGKDFSTERTVSAVEKMLLSL
jgi:glycosyltransferase involved in cell wall biosynthesis